MKQQIEPNHVLQFLGCGLAMGIVLSVSSLASAFEVDDVPMDNLVVNPWFRSPTYQPSGEGWSFYTVGSDLLWGVTNKDSQPAPDNEDEGTSVRWAETRPACTTGDRSGADAYFFQVLEANPEHRFLKFHVWWVAHEVEVLEYNIYGSSSAEGPWTLAWRPFHQVCEVDCVAEISGAGDDRTLEWINLTATTPQVEGQLEEGWAFYKVEGHVRYVKDSPDDCSVGAKTTGIYFAANATGDGDIITPPTDDDNPDGGVPGDGDNNTPDGGTNADTSGDGGCTVSARSGPSALLPLLLLFGLFWISRRTRRLVPVRRKPSRHYRGLLVGLTAPFCATASSVGLAQTEPCDYIAPYTPFVDGPGETYSRGGQSYPIGLYANGNEMPQGRLDNGAFFANQIAASGSYALVSVGMSNTHREFEEFVALAATHADHLNSKLSIVDAAIGSVDANDWSGMHTMNATCNATVNDAENPWLKFKQTLANAGVAKEEVRAIWLKLAIISPTQSKNGSGGFPSHANVLKDRIGCVARKLQSYLPNLDLIFLSSRTHAGDLSGDANANELNPEPFAYESGFSVRWLIDEQINGDHSDMPFLAWGPYLWANGQDARAYDGFVWTPLDLSHEAIDTRIDCTHPSEATGEPKVACLLWNFFSQHPLATPWFLKPGTTPPVESCASAIDYPDPVDGGTPPPGYDADAGTDGTSGNGNPTASSNGGGCSISAFPRDSASLVLWGMLFAFLWTRRRLLA